MDGTRVLATPLTITGSIGVLGGKFNVAPLLTTIGVNSAAIAHGANATMFDAFADFTPAQQQWLDRIAEVVGVNLAFARRDFNDYFQAEGGLNAANRLFGKTELGELLNELNEALVV